MTPRWKFGVRLVALALLSSVLGFACAPVVGLMAFFLGAGVWYVVSKRPAKDDGVEQSVPPSRRWTAKR
jgi:hypothetical protein